jgi:hypothetical protein
MTLATLSASRKGFIRPGGLCEPMKWTITPQINVKPTYYCPNTDIRNKAMKLKIELHSLHSFSVCQIHALRNMGSIR